jgi:pimeloyl-ACP methyl ester carboxylesterase
MPKTDPALAAYYDQLLVWHECGGADECATMKVPLDYAAPEGRAIDIKLSKAPAGDERVGTLVVNPGGPGGSGISYAEARSDAWSLDLLRHYDVVGFDPRGVGQSTPLHCLGTGPTDELLATDPDPDNAVERRRYDTLFRGFGDACLAKDAELTRHVSTLEVAKDMDVLRQVLGESKLTYFGRSYGTFLGATYAGLFPGHVGRLVLDAAIDPARSWTEFFVGQAHGYEVALRSYVAQACRVGRRCFLGGSVDQGVHRIQSLLASVERKPLPTADGRTLRIGNAVTGLLLPLQFPEAWPFLDRALQHALQGDGSELMDLSDEATSRGENRYEDNSAQVAAAVLCLDHGDTTPTDQVPRTFARFEKASPTFGRAFAFQAALCSTWPTRPTTGTSAIHAPGAPPILVLGTTRDPATPYVWAQSLAEELDSGVLVTRRGDGHGAYAQRNPCIDDAVDRYLIDGQLPRRGLTC